MLRWKLVMCVLALQNALGEDMPQIRDEELNGDSTYVNMSSRAFKETLDLEEFTNLEHIDFSNNAIVDLKWANIESAPKLKTLDLSSNPALSLPDVGPSKNLPLRVLNMSFCHVDVITKDALRGLPNLDVLDLRGNAIAYEESPVFEHLQAPPNRLIVSQITKNELSHICKHVDMLVEIIDDEMTFECKDVRRDQRGAIASSSPDREAIKNEYVIDRVMPAETHMEMLADQPTTDTEGSGNDEGSDPTDQSIEQQTDETEESAEATESTTEKTNTSTGPSIPDLIHTPEPESAEDTENSEEQSTEESDPPKYDSSDELPTDNTDVFKEESSTEKDSGQAEQVSTEHLDFTKVGDPTVDSREHHGHHEHHETRNPNIVAKHPSDKTVRKFATDIQVPREDSKDTVPILETKSAPQSATGRKVILVLVIGAAVMGSVFGLMKVYKDRKRKAKHDGAASEGQEMNVLNAEHKPLMEGGGGNGTAANGASKAAAAAAADETCAMVVVEGGPPAAAANGDSMTAKEILADAAGLPDIDDANRLSTIIVSSCTTLAEAK